MPSTLTKDNTYLVQYNIPRIVVGSVGRQNRSGDGTIRMTPGMAEPFRFLFGNNDGRPLNLNAMEVYLLLWAPKRYDENSVVMDDGIGQLIAKKKVDVVDPYTGETFVLLSGDDTTEVGRAVKMTGSARWTLIMTNPEGDMFPAQVSSSGERFGTVTIENISLPPMDIVRA